METPMRPAFCYLAFGLATGYLLAALALVCVAIWGFRSIGWWALFVLPIAYAAFISSVSLLAKARHDLHHRKVSQTFDAMTAAKKHSLVMVAGFLLATQGAAQEREAHRPRISPVPGWGRTFAYQKQQLAAMPADMVFVGDSLTEYWTSTGKAVWQLEFHEFRAVNFGIAADRTENILYRVSRADMAAQAPRMFVVLAGTNNLALEPPDSPEQTVLAIKAIVGLLAKQCPESQVFLLTLPPNGYAPQSPLRKRVIETNRLLKTLALPKQVELIDIYPVFADEADRWKPGMTIDGTHFSQRGYDVLARALAPALKALRADPKKPKGY